MGIEEQADEVHRVVATLAEKLEAEHEAKGHGGTIFVEHFGFPYNITSEGVILGTRTIKDLKKLSLEYESWIRKTLKMYGRNME